MASKEPAKTEAAAAPAPKKSKLVLILVAVLLVVVIGAGAAVFMLLSHGKKSEGGESEEKAAATHGEKAWPKFDPSKPPVFEPLEPFTVNLTPEDGQQYLQVVASIRVIDAHVAEEVKAYMPQIRHEILSLLAGKKASEIVSPEGRAELAEEMRDVINEVMGWEPPPASSKKKQAEAATGPVVSVFFTQFIVQ